MKRIIVLLVISMFFIVSCNSEPESDSGLDTSSVSIDLEVAPCMATFTEDYTVMDWGDELFTVKAGDEFIFNGIRKAGRP